MDKETIYESFKPEDTFAIGEKLGRAASPGQLVTLTGDLGVGKTASVAAVEEGTD